MIQREYQMNNGFSTGEEDSRGNSDQICCLVDDGDRCRRPAGNASYSKRIQKTVALRRLKLNIDAQVCTLHNFLQWHSQNANFSLLRITWLTKLRGQFQARHTYICDFHKTMIQCARTKQRRPKDSDNDSNEADMDAPEVDWFQLQLNTLRRYKRYYKVQTRPGLNKAQLAEVSPKIYHYIKFVLRQFYSFKDKLR